MSPEQVREHLETLRYANAQLFDAGEEALAMKASAALDALAEHIEEQDAAREVWDKLATTVGCSSPDGHAEIAQVGLVRDLLTQSEAELASLRTRLGEAERVVRDVQRKALRFAERITDNLVADRALQELLDACDNATAFLSGSAPTTEPPASDMDAERRREPFDMMAALKKALAEPTKGER